MLIEIISMAIIPITILLCDRIISEEKKDIMEDVKEDEVNECPDITYEEGPLNDIKLRRLRSLYRLKEEYTVELIKEKFNPDELSYTYFMDSILKSHEVFYQGLETADELYKIRFHGTDYDDKVKKLKNILRELEGLMIELAKSKNHLEENIVIDDLRHLKDSVKDYGGKNE